MKFRLKCLSAVAATLLLNATAHAHPSVVSGPGVANATQEVVFGVGHGCAGADTYRVKVNIPAGITSVRPMTSDFGKASVEKDAAGLITAVVWQKADADALESDTAYYKLVIRMKLPDKPFTTIYFAVQQTCRAADGALTVVDWVGLPSTPMPDGGPEIEPASPLLVLPARLPGWNKYSVAEAIPDLSAFFKDAQIVWKGTAAYSSNAATVDLIKATPGVTGLTALAAADVIWVKY